MDIAIKNMNHAINCMATAVREGNFYASEKLSKIYIKILHMTKRRGHLNRENLNDYRDEVEAHKFLVLSMIELLELRFEKTIHPLNSENANLIMTILDTLDKISEELEGLVSIIAPKKEDNAKEQCDHTKNKIKTEQENQRVKQVAIFGSTKEFAVNKMEELLKQFKEEEVLWLTTVSSGKTGFETADLKVEAFVFNKNTRGTRLDEIYVDTNLTVFDLKMIEMMKRHKNTPIHYF